MKETNFAGIKGSGFLAIFVGLLFAVLCIFLIVKDNSYAILVTLGAAIIPLLISNDSLRLKMKDAADKANNSFFIKRQKGKIKSNNPIVNAIVAYIVGMGFLFTSIDINIYNIIGVIGLAVIQPLIVRGLVKLEPNEAVVLIFFGKYRGTLKDNGFFWVNPFYAKHKMPLRVRNAAVEPIKVNDKAGNPIMIGAVLVWRIKDTYKISFEVDNKLNDVMVAAASFVNTQSDAALRQVASMYAYDNEVDGVAVTLRSGGNEVAQRLEQELNSRLAIAGIEVLEARINYLAYASEIAKTMLRRQQAEAIVAAREKVVEGAVGMVEMALQRLQRENIVKLDTQRKVIMTSNLLAILCTDENFHQS